MLKINRGSDFYRPLITLAIPLVLQQVINNSLGLIDTLMVGALGENELAAVTLGNNVLFAPMLMIFGIQSGMSILISQYWGRRDKKAINRILGLGLMTSGLLATIVVIAVMTEPRFFMSLMTPDEAIINHGAQYIAVVAPGFLLNALSMIYISAQRSMENARIGLTVLIIATLTNTFLNWVFIYGNLGFQSMGVRGAAFAMLFARLVEFTIVLVYALRSTQFPLKLKLLFRPGKVMFGDFVRYAAPVIVNEMFWGFGFMLYPIIVGNMSTAASSVSAYSIAMSIDRILSAAFFGTGTAIAVLIGKRLGEGAEGDDAYNYAKDLLKIVTAIGICFGVLMALLSTFLFKPFLFPLFSNISGETINTAWLLLLIGSLCMPFRAFNFTVIIGVLRGGGDVNAGTVIDVCFLYIIGLPIAFICGLVLDMGVYMVFGAMLADETAKSIACMWRYRKRKWIRNVTRVTTDNL